MRASTYRKLPVSQVSGRPGSCHYSVYAMLLTDAVQPTNDGQGRGMFQ
jgi:hypothetical protein